MSLEFITQDSLFTTRPPPLSSIDEVSSLEQIYTQLTTTTPPGTEVSYTTIIDQLYYSIQSHSKSNDTNTINDLLKLWDIRFNLLIFNNQLNLAQLESININNILYLQENIQDVNVNIYPLPKLDLKYYDFLIKLLKLKSDYQLCKGNSNINGNGIINEIYKLNYQLRLKESHDDVEVQLKLINLSYQLIINLIILNHVPTLFSYLNGLIHELDSNNNRSSLLNQYLSNLILVLIVVEKSLLSINVVSKPELKSILVRKYEEKYSQSINQFTKDSLSYIINKDNESAEMVSVDSIDSILEHPITFKALVNIIGVWDLTNNNKLLILVREEHDDHISLSLQDNVPSEQTQGQETEQGNAEALLVDKIYNHVNNQWYKHIDKLYGLQAIVAKT